MTTDGRIYAWAMAWQRLVAAEKIRTDVMQQKGWDGTFPELYHALSDEASVFAALTRGGLDVGLGTGVWLDTMKRQADEEIARQADSASRFFEFMAEKKTEGEGDGESGV